jgi:hypothetical protein
MQEPSANILEDSNASRPGQTFEDARFPARPLCDTYPAEDKLREP